MSSRRVESLLGPLIVLLLVGGVTAAVLGGGDDDTEFAEEPTEFADPFDDPSGDDEPVGQSPPPAEEPTVTDEVEPDATAPAAGEQDGSAGAVGSEVAVEDPTALTGGWEGGTPNTGTAISAGGLLLLAVGAGLLWLRRART